MHAHYLDCQQSPSTSRLLLEIEVSIRGFTLALTLPTQQWPTSCGNICTPQNQTKRQTLSGGSLQAHLIDDLYDPA